MTLHRFRSTPQVLAFVLAVSLARPALAEGAPPAPLAQSLSGEAKAAYESGRLLFEDGDSRGASAKFSHSYDLSHDPRLLWNMAACEKELRHYARAATLIDRYLKDGAGRISAEQRASALETQAALSAFYVKLTLTGARNGAAVFVDGDPMGHVPLSQPLLVDLGPRTLRVEQPGFEPSETKLDVAGGGELEVKVSLKSLAPDSPVSARLSVTASGAQDVVAIDGRVVAVQHWEGRLAPGEHVLRVTAPRRRAYESHLHLLANSSRTVSVTLEDENRGASIWPWIVGGAAVAAGAAVGGYFLFKPDDKAGAHPEGKLATLYVALKAVR